MDLQEIANRFDLEIAASQLTNGEGGEIGFRFVELIRIASVQLVDEDSRSFINIRIFIHC